MAAFPTIYPDSISIEPGRMVNDRLTTPSGVTTVFRRTRGVRDVLFSLTYTNLTSTSASLIRSHFQDHFDFNQTFTVPLAVLGSFAVVSSNGLFYYDSELEEEQKASNGEVLKLASMQNLNASKSNKNKENVVSKNIFSHFKKLANNNILAFLAVVSFLGILVLNFL